MHGHYHSEQRSGPGIVYEISLPVNLDDITLNVAIGRPTTSPPSSMALEPGAITPHETITLSIRRQTTHAASESPATIPTLVPHSEASCSLPHAPKEPLERSEATLPPTTSTSDDTGLLSQSPSPPVSPTPSQSALPASVIKTLFMRLPEAREFFDSIPLRTPSPASSESVLPASSPSTRPASPTHQRQPSRSPSPPAEDVSYEPGDLALPGDTRPRPTRSTSRSIGLPSRPVTPAPHPAPETISQDLSGSDTESEHDHVFDAYTLGCADGRAQGRDDALKLTGEMGDEAARIVAERVLELGRAFRDPDNPPTYVPIPNVLNGCVLTPRTRKRIAPELPPLHIIEQRVKRYKEAHALGPAEVAELLAE